MKRKKEKDKDEKWIHGNLENKVITDKDRYWVWFIRKRERERERTGEENEFVLIV